MTFGPKACRLKHLPAYDTGVFDGPTIAARLHSRPRREPTLRLAGRCRRAAFSVPGFCDRSLPPGRGADPTKSGVKSSTATAPKSAP